MSVCVCQGYQVSQQSGQIYGADLVRMFVFACVWLLSQSPILFAFSVHLLGLSPRLPRKMFPFDDSESNRRTVRDSGTVWLSQCLIVWGSLTCLKVTCTCIIYGEIVYLVIILGWRRSSHVSFINFPLQVWRRRYSHSSLSGAIWATGWAKNEIRAQEQQQQQPNTATRWRRKKEAQAVSNMW